VEFTIAKLQHDDQLFWPMMPGDTLEKLANHLYPNSPILQQRFIIKTISLTKSLGLDIQANSLFKAPQFILIPNEKTVREFTHRIKKIENDKSTQDTLKLSYGLDFSMPKDDTVEQVDSNHKSSLLNFNMANLTVPKVQIQSLGLSTLHVPSLNLKPLKSKVTSQWSVISEKSLLVSKKLSQETMQVINDYKHHNLNQIMNNYRLRNIALISILMLVFAFIWVAHKSRQRIQAVMLSGISSPFKNEDSG